MTQCPACGYEYTGKRKVVRKPDAPEICLCERCGYAWAPGVQYNQAKLLELKRKVIDNYEYVYINAKKARIQQAVLNRLGRKCRGPHRFNYKKMFKTIINDSLINYNFRDYIRESHNLNDKTDGFKVVSKDIITMKELVSQNEIDIITYNYVLLWFYSTNFDTLINFLKPIAKALRQRNSYSLERADHSSMDKKSAECVIKMFEYYNSKFHKILLRMFDRDLRNSVAHNDYYINKDEIVYNIKKDRKVIKLDLLYNMFLLTGEVINRLQILQFEYECKWRKRIIRMNLLPDKLVQFLESFKM